MKLFSILSLFIALSLSVSAAEKGSTPIKEAGKTANVKALDFEGQLPVAETHAEALVRAKKENRLVMVVFASSSCPHCDAFRKGVLGTAEFRAFAKEKLVLVVFDLSFYDVMTDFEKIMIEQLKERYRVKGTPHLVIESPAEKQLLATEGYRGSPAEKVVGDLQKLWAGVFP